MENLVRVVEVGEDHRETGEVILQFLGQRPVLSKKARQRARFDGMDLVGQATRQGELRDVRITEDGEARLREVVAEGR